MNISQSCKRISLSWVWMISAWLVLLAACNPVSPSPAPATTQPTAAASPSPTASKPAVPQQTNTPTLTPTPISWLNLTADDLHGAIVRYWHTWTGSAGETMQALVDEFNTSNEWKIIVSPVQVGGLDEMDERVRAALAGADSPEIVMGYLYQALSWDQQRPLVDLGRYINDPLWGLTADEQADYYAAFWNHDLKAVNGATAVRRLGIPAQRSAQLLFYNRAWARSLGFLVPPATPQDFRQQACATAAINRQDAIQENNGTGGWIISTDYHAMFSWLNAYSSQVISPTVTAGQNPYNFSSSETRAAFRFLRDLYDQGCAWLLDMEGGEENRYPELEFTTRHGLFTVGSLLDIPYQVQAFATAEYQDEWTVIPFPSAQGKPLITVYGPSFSLLFSSPERQLAAWLFLKWLSQPKQQARLVQVSGAFPLRKSVLAELSAYSKQNPQWAAAVDLLPLAQSEPAFQSWSTVRWALGDASTQLFRSYFTVEQVPSLANYLNETAYELHQSFLPLTPTSTDSPTRTATHASTMTLLPSQSQVPSLTPIPSKTP